MLEGRLDQAIVSFDAALKLEPEHAFARYNRGVALLKKRAPAAAIQEFDHIVRLEGSELRARAAYHRGLAEEQLRRYDRAAASFEEALKLDRDLDAALLALGVARERQGDFQAAGRAYKMYLERRPDTPVALLRFGIAAHRAGRHETAVPYLRRVVALAPRTPEGVEAQKFLVMWE